jgi:hypothetical protein
MLPALLIVLCVALRIAPHPPNFAPVGATAVFAGRTLPTWLAIVLTCAAMLVGDFFLSRIQGYPFLTLVTPFVYSGFAVQALLGRALRRRPGGAVGAAVVGAFAFFLISNFGVWVGGLYGHSLPGLVACYVAAIPFFGPTLAGDVFWTLALVLTYRAFAKRLESHGGWWVPIRSPDQRLF